jgi:hypothetical protein
MEIMYLAHINFLPVENARIIDSALEGSDYLHVTHVFKDLYQSNEDYRQMIDGFTQDPEKHRDFAPGGVIDPEVVLAINPLPGKDGWASSLQLHPDGAADFVSYRPSEFAHSLRWICRSADQEALGLLLPSTAEPDGYLAERAKGNLVIVNPKSEARFAFECGALDEAATTELSREILEVRSMGDKSKK